ncbi:hypothetical protein N2152v2_006323 [Parachlorella kessleri]
MAAPRPFHIVIWGATGFTGRLVCEHVARDYKGQVKWAMAGRNKQRLEEIRQELSKTYGEDLKDVPILLGDINDQPSIDAIAKDTHVIVSTAGPFMRLGKPIVDAAVRQGTHYCDITGETNYVMDLIKTYDEQAKAKNVRIVPCCGYDSIPSDLGAFFVADYIKKELGKQTAKVVNVILSGKGGVSGGTVASGMELVEAAKRPGVPQDTGVYSHVPPAAPKGDDKEVWGPAYEPTLKKWVAPFIMQVINNRVVHRSAALLGYGDSFHYQEGIATSGWLAASAVAVGTAATALALSQVWVHPLLKRVLPAPGQGPSRDAMLNGHYKHSIVGYTQEAGGAKPTVVVAELGDPKRDPGYWGTSRMLLEAGLCLALQQGELDRRQPVKGGVLTPATAMGSFLIERLRKAGLTYEVKEVMRPQQ